MKRTHNIAAIALTGLIGLTTISAPLAASASQEGKRNTTYALGAAAAALLLTQKNKLPGLLAAGGAVYAYTQQNKDSRDHGRWDNRGYDYNQRDRRDRAQDDRRFQQNDDHSDRVNADAGYRHNEGDGSRNRDENRDNNQSHFGR